MKRKKEDEKIKRKNEFKRKKEPSQRRRYDESIKKGVAS